MLKKLRDNILFLLFAIVAFCVTWYLGDWVVLLGLTALIILMGSEIKQQFKHKKPQDKPHD